MVFAETTEEVAEIVRKICAAHKVPVIPFGDGNIAGRPRECAAWRYFDRLSRMNRILEVNSDDLDCRVEAGVTRKQLNSYIRDTGLFFPIDPGADASWAAWRQPVRPAPMRCATAP